MTTTSFDRDFWDQLWSRTLRERADAVADRPPNAHLTAEVEDLRPGRAVDAGCGHGSDTIWLAAHGWQVTAVDFSAAALAHARSTVEAAGPDVARRVDWVEADLETWTPPPDHYDLVACLYVHIAGTVEEMVRRIGRESPLPAPSFWSGTARSTRPPEPQHPRPVRCRSRSKRRSPRSIPAVGNSSSPRIVRGPPPAPVSTR